MDLNTARMAFGLVLSLFAFGAGCHESAHEHEGVASGATCPTTNAPDYENFGRAFMTSYCTRCHSSTLRGANRNGASKGHDFDSSDGVLAVMDHVDQHAAAGPNGVNDEMPPSAPFPAEEERKKLGQWLACEQVRPDGATGSAGDATAP
ncbi:MAG: hypothetical protein SGI86_04350 [Deltaproteobacteria bacterium]|nr:hypothetical protein [Deltaproteobacteria bacterium]